MTEEKTQVIENKPKIVLAFGIQENMMYSDMASKKQKIPAKVSFTPSQRDYAIIQAGIEKHGSNLTGIIRMALRRFAEAEGFQVAS